VYILLETKQAQKPNMTDQRRYTESEIQALLKAAAERQQHTNPTDPSGLTLDELERIAQDAGIDPEHHRAAALALEAEPTDIIEMSKLWRGPTEVEIERVVEGEIRQISSMPCWSPVIRETMGEKDAKNC
jgi:hypothetical protein